MSRVGALPIEMTRAATGLATVGHARRIHGEPFENVLERTIRRSAPVTFSAHALNRLSARKIRISEPERERINQAADHAAAKGARESLFVGPNYALVVSIHNRTVITAMDLARMRESVVTNIDSAVWL